MPTSNPFLNVINSIPSSSGYVPSNPLRDLVNNMGSQMHGANLSGMQPDWSVSSDFINVLASLPKYQMPKVDLSPILNSYNSLPTAPDIIGQANAAFSSIPKPHGVDVSGDLAGMKDYTAQDFASLAAAHAAKLGKHFTPVSANQDAATLPPALRAASAQPSSNSSSFLGSILGGIGHGIENAYDHAKGALEGAIGGMLSHTTNHAVKGKPLPPGTKFSMPITGLVPGLVSGLKNPVAAKQNYDQQVQNQVDIMKQQGATPFAQGLLRGDLAAYSDPLTYTPMPVGKVADLLGVTKAAKAVGSAVKDSKVAQSKPVQSVVQGLGKNFVKYYGAQPAVKDALKQNENTLTHLNTNIDNEMLNLAKQHNLTKAERDILPHVWEGTQTTTNPKILNAINDLKDALTNGTGAFKGQIGTNAELNTLLNDQPILQNLRQNYFPHSYLNDEKDVQKISDGAPTKSFSTTGPFNQQRQFNTLQEAMDAGLKPQLDPYLAVAGRLKQSAKAVTNANTINDLLRQGAISTEELPGTVRSQVLNSLKWLDNTARPATETKTQMLKDAIGSSPINVNVEGSHAVPLNPETSSLPKDLLGAKPRYKSLPIEFSNPFDKAAYIVGNTTNRSARDSDYLTALMNHTGLDEPSVRALGQTVRDTLKQHAVLADGGVIKLPQVLQSYATKELDKASPIAAEAHVAAPSELKDDSYFNSLLGTLPNAAQRVSYHVNPGDENALKQALSPARTTGPFLSAYDKATELWKRGFLYNPVIHGHNITYNGMYLGGADPAHVNEAFTAIKNNPTSYDWYQRALKNGAISADKSGNELASKLKNVYSDTAPPIPKALSKAMQIPKYAAHGALWDADKAIRTALFRKAVENGATDAEAAKNVNKFMVDYNNTTPFEKNVMKRAFPFYTWKKGNLPLQIAQWVNNTPKQAVYEVLKNAISNGMSGQDTQDGKINTGIKFPGGTLMVDPYAPSDDPIKAMRDGALPYVFSSLQPIAKEGINQLADKAYYPFASVAPNGKESMANSTIGINGAPTSYNVGKRLEHAVGNLLPFGGFPVKQGIDAAFHLPGSTKPAAPFDQSALQTLLRGAGTFPSTDNPALDEYYQEKDQQAQLQGFIKYLKTVGSPVPKVLTKAAYATIPYPGGQ